VTRGTGRWAVLWLAVACVPADPPGGERPRRQTPPAKTTAGKAESVAAEAGPSELTITAEPLLERTFSDRFERAALGADYAATSPAWQLADGRLCGRGAKNRPVWLRRRLPVNVRVEFDAVTASSDGDIKVELFGDGRSRPRSNAYTDATSYLAVFGGWKNSFHVLARLDEHAPGRLELGIDEASADPRARPVEANRRYHFMLERLDGRTLRWFVDGVVMFRLVDPEPLRGDGHEYFAFNDWETPVCFDNLVIHPLGG
jgi:hypothetical protein